MTTALSIDNPIDVHPVWFERASVRVKERQLLDKTSTNLHFYPFMRQPLVIHPLVMEQGEKTITYILAQTSYRYMYEIATLETETVNRIALKIANNLSPLQFSDSLRQEALSVIVDEAFHAYVAFDFINQVKTFTGIQPIALPTTNAVSRSLDKFKNKLSDYHYSIIEIVAIALSENVLTKDLVYLKEDKETNVFFTQIMQDHLLDEGRHAGYFTQILKLVWNNIPASVQEVIANFIPEFIDDYINPEANKTFDKAILLSLGFEDNIAEEIIIDTYYSEKEKNNDPSVASFLTVLRRSELLKNQTVISALRNNHFIIDHQA